MITDDELLLYHYRDGLDAAERARIGAALSEPELAQRLQALVSRLDAATAMPEVSVPEHTQRRWEVALELAARKGTRATCVCRRQPVDGTLDGWRPRRRLPWSRSSR